MQPEGVADLVVQAIREDRFYIFTHPATMEGIEVRFNDVLAARNPTPGYHELSKVE
jgi:hypothetical protein